MSSVFGYHPWRVEELVSGVDKGTIRLPDLQRPFVWTNAKVRDLIDSMYRGYPVGELMFWASPDPTKTKAIGTETKTQDVSMQVVDGQQRLTSLYAVMKGVKVWREDYTREVIRLAFNPLTERFEVPNKATERSAEWINDILPVFDDPIDARYKYLDALREHSGHDLAKDIERGVEMALQRLTNLRSYQFQVVQITEEVSREVVADIFVRTNSEGMPLSSADFILTWMSVFWEEGREQLETFARNSRFTPTEIETVMGEKVTWTPKNPYLAFEPGQVLRVAIAVGLRRARLQDAYNTLRGRDPRTREIDPERRKVELERLKLGQAHTTRPTNLDEYLKVLERAGFRTKEMITSQNNLLYTYALWIIGRVDFNVPVDELREVMARWFFMSQITGRYTNSPETRMQEDLNRLDGLPENPAEFVKRLNQQIDAAITEDWWRVTLPDDLETSSILAPAYVAYIAALNILDADVLLATTKVKDWINPARRPIKGIEKHHLFPRDYLKTVHGLKDNRRLNQVANYALVEWSDNITISNQAPTDYWPQEVADKQIEDKRRRQQEEWHALPENWTTMEYGEFLEQRRKSMARVIREAFRRLTDPNYEPDLSEPGTQQAQPAQSAQPGGAPADSAAAAADAEPEQIHLPTFEHLVLEGHLPADTMLTPADPDRAEVIAEITDDGLIRVGEHLCETVEKSAREAGAEEGSGWDFWVAHLDAAEEPVLLADLREQVAHAAAQRTDN